MTLQLLFWFLYILSLVLILVFGYTPGQPYPIRTWGGIVLIFILIGLLGWEVFGAAVHR